MSHNKNYDPADDFQARHNENSLMELMFHHFTCNITRAKCNQTKVERCNKINEVKFPNARSSPPLT